MVCKVTLDLAEKSEREAELHTDGGRASVAIDSSKVSISGIDTGTPTEAQVKARAIAARLLDILCSMYDHCLVLGQADPVSERIDRVRSALCEAGDGAKAFMVQNGTCVSVTCRLQSHDSAGNVIADSWKPGLIPFEHMPAMAFFRTAVMTKNVFHKFQDFYLAIENAASYLHQGLRYGPLLQAALATVYQAKLGELAAAAAKVNLACTQADAVAQVKTCLWDDFRLGLFHAGQEPVTIVSDPDQEARVAGVIPLAQQVARDMIRFAAQQNLAAAPKPSP